MSCVVAIAVVVFIVGAVVPNYTVWLNEINLPPTSPPPPPSLPWCLWFVAAYPAEFCGWSEGFTSRFASWGGSSPRCWPSFSPHLSVVVPATLPYGMFAVVERSDRSLVPLLLLLEGCSVFLATSWCSVLANVERFVMPTPLETHMVVLVVLLPPSNASWAFSSHLRLASAIITNQAATSPLQRIRSRSFAIGSAASLPPVLKTKISYTLSHPEISNFRMWIERIIK
jgi:hypothetical protein